MAICLKELFDASVALEGNEWNAEILSELDACKGILLFADEQQRPIQLLQSANLRRTAQARLLRDRQPAAIPRADLSVLTRHIFSTCGYSDFMTWLEFLRAARSLPGLNMTESVRLPAVSFAAIDLHAPLPYFYVSSNPAVSPKRKAWGLFASRRAVQDFCQLLNTIFVLCRNPSLLQSGNERSCPYFQMHQCPGPCLGNTIGQPYAESMKDALVVADGETDVFTHKYQTEMHRLAAEKKFEAAQLYKNRVELLGRVKQTTGRWTQNLERLCFLHVDRGPKIQYEGKKRKHQQFIAWKITNTRIDEIGRFTLDRPDEWVKSFPDAWQKPQATCMQLTPAEHFGLLSLLLFRSRPQGLWLNVSRALPDALLILNETAELFGKNKEDAEHDTTSS